MKHIYQEEMHTRDRYQECGFGPAPPIREKVKIQYARKGFLSRDLENRSDPQVGATSERFLFLKITPALYAGA